MKVRDILEAQMRKGAADNFTKQKTKTVWRNLMELRIYAVAALILIGPVVMNSIVVDFLGGAGLGLGNAIQFGAVGLLFYVLGLYTGSEEMYLFLNGFMLRRAQIEDIGNDKFRMVYELGTSKFQGVVTNDGTQIHADQDLDLDDLIEMIPEGKEREQVRELISEIKRLKSFIEEETKQ